VSAGAVQRVDRRESEQRSREHDAEVDFVAMLEARTAYLLGPIGDLVYTGTTARLGLRNLENVHSTGRAVTPYAWQVGFGMSGHCEVAPGK